MKTANEVAKELADGLEDGSVSVRPESSLTAEERAALERLNDNTYTGPMHEIPLQLAGDLSVIGRLALREHPSDENELLDSEWIELSGISTKAQDEGFFMFCDRGQWQAWLSAHSTTTILDHCAFVRLRDVETRGDFRLLRRALGI